MEGGLTCVERLLREVIPSPGAAEKHKSWDDLHTAATCSWLCAADARRLYIESRTMPSCLQDDGLV